LKIGLFTDAHYCRAERLCRTRRPSLSLEKIREAMTFFQKEQVDLCICLGDLCDHGENDTKESVTECFREAVSLILSFDIPFYLVPGNHDYLMMTGEEIFDVCRCPAPPCVIRFGARQLILLDANYRANGVRFDRAGVEWTDANLPDAQLTFLKAALADAAGECVVMIHENLDPLIDERHVVKNAADVRTLLENSGKVRTVIQGHYHKGGEHVINGIRYVTLPAMCEGEKNSFAVFSSSIDILKKA